MAGKPSDPICLSKEIPRVIEIGFDPLRVYEDWEKSHVFRTLHLLLYHAVGIAQYMYTVKGKLKHNDGRKAFLMGTAATKKAMFNFWYEEIGLAADEEFCSHAWKWVASALEAEGRFINHSQEKVPHIVLGWRYRRPEVECFCSWCFEKYTRKADETGRVNGSYVYLDLDSEAQENHATKRSKRKREFLRGQGLMLCDKCGRRIERIKSAKLTIEVLNADTKRARELLEKLAKDKGKLKFEIDPSHEVATRRRHFGHIR